MEKIIDVKNLNKSFGDVHAVKDLSFHVKQGELFAFLGVNGAGKSTTISIICGQLAKDSGSVIVNGKNVTPYIRENSISMAASTISKIPQVRIKLVELQREIAAKSDCVLDGRDIGSYVLPNADYKIYMSSYENHYNKISSFLTRMTLLYILFILKEKYN